MKNAVLVSAVGVAGLACSGLASAQDMAQEVGRVISSTPVVQQVPVQRQVCSAQPVAVQQPQSSGAGAVIGAIAGGILGHSVGGGFGKAAATGIGAVAGAAVGDNLERRGDYPQQAMAQQCGVQTTYENRTVGYNVQYEYAGRTYSTQMPYDPGPTIRVQVSPVSSAQPADGVQTIAAPAYAPVYAPQTPSVVYPAYSYPPAYYERPWYPPVSLSLGYVWSGGGHRHWRH